jgi:hypothetical protein
VVYAYLSIFTSCLSFQTNAIRLPLILTHMLPHFNFSVFLSRTLGIPLHVCFTTVETSCVQLIKYIWRGEEIVHIKLVTHSLLSWSDFCSMCSCHHLCYTLPKLSEVYIHIIHTASHVTVSVNFNMKALVSLEYIVLK